MQEAQTWARAAEQRARDAAAEAAALGARATAAEQRGAAAEAAAAERQARLAAQSMGFLAALAAAQGAAARELRLCKERTEAAEARVVAAEGVPRGTVCCVL